MGGRADELHAVGPDAVREAAQAGRDGAGRADPLVDASGVRRRPVRGARRHELLRTARRRRGRAAHPAAPVLDAAADEVGADVDGGTGVRGHVADAGGVGPGPGRRPRQRPVRRPAADLHRPAVAVVRLPRRRWRRELEGDSGDRLGRWRRRGHMDGRDPAAGLVGGRDRRGGRRSRRAGRLGDRADRRARVGGSGAGRQLRLRRAAARKRRATHPLRVLGLALVADGSARRAAADDAARRHPHRRGPRERLPLADVSVLHPRDLRRRPVRERRRQGEDLLARHPAAGGERRCRRRRGRRRSSTRRSRRS